ncbi:MAG: hypothetical protein EZS28_054046, partial [Streblomastix strix]
MGGQIGQGLFQARDP